jgi:uncharacterized protein (TIGR03435 family)
LVHLPTIIEGTIILGKKTILVSIVVGIGIGCSPTLLLAQPTGFEVAAVKLNKQGARGSALPPPKDGRFNATNVSLKDLVLYAYHILDFQLSGIQSWMDSDHYDVIAKATSPNVNEDQVRVMVQVLLADRFSLKVHQEQKQLPVYAMIIGKDGLKMAHSTEDCLVPGTREMPCGGFRISQRRNLAGRNVPIGELMDILGFLTGRHIVNKTGLTGNFDIQLQWSPDETLALGPEAAAPADEPNGASLFTALQQQLGLKLEPQKGLVPIFVIDHAARLPVN